MPAPPSMPINSRSPLPGSGFPAHAAIALMCAAAVLIGWHFWKRAPGHGGMPPSEFREAFALHLRQKPAVKAGRTALNGVQGTLKNPPPELKAGARPPISDVFVDDSGALDPFFAALWHLEQGKAGRGSMSPTHADDKAVVMNGPPKVDVDDKAVSTDGAPKVSSGFVSPTHADDKTVVMNGPPAASAPSAAADVVTVLHYGDSPTTADLITGDARALLQERFGDAGHGFNLPAKPWAWYGHRDVAISDSGWKSLTPVGSMREGIYGLGGATLVGGVGAKSRFRLADASQDEVELSYFDEPGGGSFRVSADDKVLQTISTGPADSKADVPTYTTVKLPAGTKEVALEVTTGTVKMLGADFRKAGSGVLYDSLGLNGATTSVMARGFGKATWPVELAHAHPALVVINYGTNESSFGAWVNKGYEGELRMAVAKVRSAMPDVPILIMSPMDRGERAGLNDIQTMATIPQIVAIQKGVAADLHCGFFDTYDAMGGDGTMAAWYNGKPRLVSADLIHPSPAGALIVAKALVSNLMLGYDRWKRVHDIAVVPTALAAPIKVEAKPQAVVAEPAKQQKRNAADAKSAKDATGAVATPKDAAKETAPAPKDHKEDKPDVPAAPAAAPPKVPQPPQAEKSKTPDGKTPDTRN